MKEILRKAVIGGYNYSIILAGSIPAYGAMRKYERILAEKLGFCPGHNSDSPQVCKEWHGIYELYRNLDRSISRGIHSGPYTLEKFKVAVEQLREIFRLCKVYQIEFVPGRWNNNFHWEGKRIHLGYTYFPEGAEQFKKDFIMFDRLAKHYEIRLAKHQLN